MKAGKLFIISFSIFALNVFSVFLNSFEYSSFPAYSLASTKVAYRQMIVLLNVQKLIEGSVKIAFIC